MNIILDLSYPSWKFFALFLPLAALLYQLCPKNKRRFFLLLLDLVFFWSFSGALIVFPIYAGILTYGCGIWLSRINGRRKELGRKQTTKMKKRALLIGILLLLAALAAMKYLDFFGLNLVRLSRLFHGNLDWKILDLVVPAGISYYTLEAISYLTDVYRETIPVEKDFFRLFLYLSFFPKLLEGPITRYGEVSESLSAGEPITADSLSRGYQRILWGCFKKIVIADHLAPAVDILFQGNVMDGSLTVAAALFFTIQEYMDFSGTIDIVIGSARIFQITLSENFRQPFFAKNASDFWRRWHITLGTWFRDYIFYPVTLSKPIMKLAKKVKKSLGARLGKLLAPAIALFCVWLANGLWHGPKWTYIFFGLYYFFWVELENILEEPFLGLLKKLHLTEKSISVRIFRFVKLVCIVITGELFFRADTLSFGWDMFKQVFTNFHFHVFTDNLGLLGMDFWDYWTVIVGLLVVTAVSVMKEKGVPIRGKLMSLPAPVRFLFWYICIFVVILFGAYGSGYDAAGMIYAKF